MNAIHRKLLRWYDSEKRDLPWRQSRDPYSVWVSEIMLQQTQVATVTPYFERWMKRFPTVEKLAASDTQEVLAVWQGLGYYRRCRMLHDGARYVVENGFPRSAKEWKSVPGVGRYTAAAISSIALNEPAPLVDGNVERVYARLSGDISAGKDLHDAAWRWAEENIPSAHPGDWNQALMELGACICKPMTPNCAACPLQDACIGHRKGIAASLPTKMPKPQQVRLEEIVWIPYYRGEFGVSQIPDGQWWHGMWEFPRLSSEGDERDLRVIVGQGALEHAGLLTYHVTHHRIRMSAFLHHSNRKSKSLRWVPALDMASLPMPSPQRKALKLALVRLAAPSLVSEEALAR